MFSFQKCKPPTAILACGFYTSDVQDSKALWIIYIQISEASRLFAYGIMASLRVTVRNKLEVQVLAHEPQSPGLMNHMCDTQSRYIL